MVIDQSTRSEAVFVKAVVALFVDIDKVDFGHQAFQTGYIEGGSGQESVLSVAFGEGGTTPSARIPVLLMTQKKITDKGQPYKNFEDSKFIINATLTSSGKTLYQRIYEGIEYFEITDGRKTSYASDDAKKLDDSPDI